MIAAIPKPVRHNPFVQGSLLAKQFDAILKAYAIGHRDILRGGATRCTGNSLANHFWLGYDGAPPSRTPKGTLAWACYRAGQTQRLADDQRGVHIPAKTNSCVPKS